MSFIQFLSSRQTTSLPVHLFFALSAFAASRYNYCLLCLALLDGTVLFSGLHRATCLRPLSIADFAAKLRHGFGCGRGRGETHGGEEDGDHDEETHV